jgi:hypothetical protein
MDLDEFINSTRIPDGIYKIEAGDKKLDIKIMGFSDFRNVNAEEEDGSFLCCLGGAVTNREESNPPFFSGLSISEKLRLPAISISDPTLDLHEKLSLSWYAGNHVFRDVMSWIEKIICKISILYSLRPVIFGGSGGGFAALRLSQVLTIRATVVVWNPQTSISEYFVNKVDEYIKVAFPKLVVEGAIGKRNFNKIALEQSEVFHDLSLGCKSQEVDVIFMQNISDWHLSAHAIPYLKPGPTWVRKGNATFKTPQASLLFFGDWGEGHVPPPRRMVEDVLIYSSKNNGGVADDVANLLSESPLIQLFSELDPSNIYRPIASFSIGVNGLEIIITPPSDEGQSSFSYALYVIHEDVKKRVFWYQKSSVFTVDIGSFEFDKIAIFVKDVVGDKRSDSIKNPYCE